MNILVIIILMTKDLANRPRIEVHPLSIGGKEDPARLVFDESAKYCCCKNK